MNSKALSAKQPSGKVLTEIASTCPRCGSTARRVEAQFCSGCGTSRAETYLPANALRASYGLCHPAPETRPESIVSPKQMTHLRLSISRRKDNNGASTTGIAFVTYALVPYLGILFCPGAVLMGSLGLYRSYRLPDRVGRRDSYVSLIFGLVIFAGQIFLWWILYKMPEWAGRF